MSPSSATFHRWIRNSWLKEIHQMKKRQGKNPIKLYIIIKIITFFFFLHHIISWYFFICNILLINWSGTFLLGSPSLRCFRWGFEHAYRWTNNVIYFTTHTGKIKTEVHLYYMLQTIHTSNELTFDHFWNNFYLRTLLEQDFIQYITHWNVLIRLV